MSQQLAASKSSDLSAQVEEIAGISFIAAQVEGDSKAMMQTLDTVRSQLPSDAVVVLAAIDKGRVGMVSAIGKTLSERLSAAELMQTVAPLVGAKGGGRPDLARAGGGDQVDAVEQAFTAARQWVESQLAS
jgi:alanyl-tRNA synthetase